MSKRILRLFRSSRGIIVIGGLSAVVLFGGCAVSSQQGNDNDARGDTVLEKEVSSETKTASNVSKYETVLQSAAEGYEEGLAEALRRNAETSETTASEENTPGGSEDGEEVAEKKADDKDSESLRTREGSLETASDGDDESMTKTPGETDTRDDMESERVEEEKTRDIVAVDEGRVRKTEEKADDEASAVESTKEPEEEVVDAAPSRDGMFEEDSVTYYDLEKQSDETYAAVRETVLAETGGKAGFISSYQNRIIQLVNAERAKCGLSALDWDSGAYQVATIRATEIVSCGSHTRPNGGPWYSVFGDYNIQPVPSGAGENVAGGQVTPEEVMAGWLASPGHYANIVRPEFTGMATACYYDPDSTYKFHWVQTFVTR